MAAISKLKPGQTVYTVHGMARLATRDELKALKASASQSPTVTP